MSIDLSISETVCNLTSRISITLNEGTETINNVNLNLWLDSLYEVLIIRDLLNKMEIIFYGILI